MTPCARVAVDWHVVGATGGHAKKKGHNRKQERAARLAAARHPAQLVQRAHGVTVTAGARGTKRARTTSYEVEFKRQRAIAKAMRGEALASTPSASAAAAAEESSRAPTYGRPTKYARRKDPPKWAAVEKSVLDALMRGELYPADPRCVHTILSVAKGAGMALASAAAREAGASKTEADAAAAAQFGVSARTVREKTAKLAGSDNVGIMAALRDRRGQFAKTAIAILARPDVEVRGRGGWPPCRATASRNRGVRAEGCCEVARWLLGARAHELLGPDVR